MYQIKKRNEKIFLTTIIIIINIIMITKTKNKNYYYLKRIEFIEKNGRQYNESNLVTFEDKLNWLLIHDTNELKGKCADKILLHEYSKIKIGKDICNKIIKIYKNTKQINFNELPDKYVIKTNHGSGFNIIVTNKTELNYTLIKNLLNEWMKIDYGKAGAEFHYSFINILNLNSNYFLNFYDLY